MNKAVVAVVAVAGVGIVAYLLWKYLRSAYSPQSAFGSVQNAIEPYLNDSQAMNQFQEQEVGGNPLQTIIKTLENLTVSETTNAQGNYVNEWYVVPNKNVTHIVSSSGGGSVHYWTPQSSGVQLWQNNATQGKIIRAL